MSFETIKTIKGHKYKYTVESYREDGKNKQRIIKYHGRVDKVPIPTGGFNIPDGFYYFSKEGCGACMPEKELREFFEPYLIRGKLKLIIHYIDLSKNTTPINVLNTPTFIDVDKGKLWVGVGGGGLEMMYFLMYKMGTNKVDDINTELLAEGRAKRKDEIGIQIKNGKKYRELHKMYDHMGDHQLITELLNESKSKCKDGVCTIKQC